MSPLFNLAILIMSVVVHEVSHGLAALWQGDRTAQYEGRLTLNPIKHIDPVGSVVVPLLCALLPGSLMFGWAKPVPYNPYNLKNGRTSEFLVAFAGPFSNIAIALLGALIIRSFGATLPEATLSILAMTILINLVLALFNLVPLPPLDGSKILANILPYQASLKLNQFYVTYGLYATLFFIFFVWQYFVPVIFWVYKIFVGV
jgi:Zn-dependent protease